MGRIRCTRILRGVGCGYHPGDGHPGVRHLPSPVACRRSKAADRMSDPEAGVRMVSGVSILRQVCPARQPREDCPVPCQSASAQPGPAQHQTGRGSGYRQHPDDNHQSCRTDGQWSGCKGKRRISPVSISGSAGSKAAALLSSSSTTSAEALKTSCARVQRRPPPASARGGQVRRDAPVRSGPSASE